MANIKSAEKRIRVSAKRRSLNVAKKSALRTKIKRFETAIAENNANSKEYLFDATRALDKAASKGIIHKNAAARKKSRLTKRFNSLQA